MDLRRKYPLICYSIATKLTTTDDVSHSVNLQLIWHLYSAQAYGIFHGDLDFCFGGWDGRSGVGKIDTKKCPVFMFTSEYDWSNTTAMLSP